MATLTPDVGQFLPEWIATRRWYTGKGREPQLRVLGSLRWPDPADEVGIETYLVVDTSGSSPVVYQVPLTFRLAPVESMHTALVGTSEHSELGTRYVYDATCDTVYVQALLATMLDSGTVSGVDSNGDEGENAASAIGHALPGAPRTGQVRRSTVLSGEQSNTSVIVELEPHDSHDQPPAPVIVKIFRVLHEGENPDVAVQSALAEAGSTFVPTPVGALSGTWQAPDGSTVTGHLAFAQEFLPGVQDAWRRALEAARGGVDFSEAARTLGQATASVHATLREAFPVAEVSPEHRAALVTRMMERRDDAIAEVPDLAAHAEAIAALYRVAQGESWPALQRIHGDYHLGQVLDTPARGWVVVDFEGEPLRSLQERTAPDAALRDVAGMLRSFDYAAGATARGPQPRPDDASLAAWAQACRAAFLEGYAAAGDDPDAHATLLAALELDKALYEVVYEARNRPAWLQIPLGAVARLLA